MGSRVVVIRYFSYMYLHGEVASRYTCYLCCYGFWFRPGGCALAGRYKKGIAINGPKGWPIIRSFRDMSVALAHRKLDSLAHLPGAKKLMAFSLG